MPGTGDSPAGLPFEEDVVSDLRDSVVSELVRFVHTLRGGGVVLPANAALPAARALVVVGLDDRDRVKTALQATLVTRQEDIATFHRHFPAFWRRITPFVETGVSDDPSEVTSGSEFRPTSGRLGDEATELSPLHRASLSASNRLQPDSDSSETAGATTYSPVGTRELITLDPTALYPDQRITASVEQLPQVLAAAPGRRSKPAATGNQVDARRLLRMNVSTGGVVPVLPRQTRQRTTPRCVILADVSRSVLDTVERSFLLAFLRAACAAWRGCRIFFFDSDIREVTASFKTPTVAAAVEALRHAETAWGGGTRIGGAIAHLRENRPELVNRRTVIFVISDGLEMGEVEKLEAEAVWLARKARGVLWLNPLAGSAGYEPTARGMAVALPHVDGLFAFAGPSDLEELVAELSRYGLGGPIGYVYNSPLGDTAQ